MYNAILVVHIIVAISMIGLILVQHGKGADAGAVQGVRPLYLVRLALPIF